MNSSKEQVIYSIFTYINILHLIGFSIITSFFTYKTNLFILNISAIIVFFIINLLINGLLYLVAAKYKWNIWINLIIVNIVGFIYVGGLLITGMLLTFPVIDKLYID